MTSRQAPAKRQAQQRLWAACSAALHRRCGASPGLHARDPIDQSHFPQRHDGEDLRGKARSTRVAGRRADPMFTVGLECFGACEPQAAKRVLL